MIFRTPEAPGPRPIVQGADGYKYYQDTGERVLPDVEAPPGPTGYIATGEAAAALGLDPENAYNVSVDGGQMKASQIGGSGTTVNIGSEIGTIPTGYELVTDPNTGARRLNAISGGPADSTKDLGATISEAETALELITSIKNDPALPSITGNVQGRLPAGIPWVTGGQAGANLSTKIEQIKGKAFMQAFQTLKGGGQITEREGQVAQNAIARLQTVQDDGSFIEALSDLEAVVLAGLRRSRGEQVDEYYSDPLGLRGQK